MGFFSKNNASSDNTNQPPRNPSNLVMFRLLAIGYVAYLCFGMIKLYLGGGPDAPSLPMLIGGVAFLGGGCIFMAVITYREWKRNKAKYDAYMAEVRAEAEAKRAAEEAAEAEADDDYEEYEDYDEEETPALPEVSNTPAEPED